MVAYVKLWGETVGAVSWNNDQQLALMEFSEDFLKSGIDLAPITMPLATLQKGKRLFSFPNLPRSTFNGLPGLLADSLPDRYGNQLIDAWLARQGRSSADFNPVERLCYMGHRSMGALEYEPYLSRESTETVSLEIAELVALARQVLQQKEKLNARANENYEQALKEIIRVGTSAGGARAKAVIAINAKGEIRSGQVAVGSGFQHWLLKFDGISDEELGEPAGFGRIEFAYYNMAVAAGITMAPCRLLDEGGRAHFMTKRFDRNEKGQKIHMQTLCGLAHFDYNDSASYSYEQLFQVMRKLRLPYVDAEKMYRRMVFNVLARNQDDHTKNISFLLDENNNWRLSPAYDLTYSYNPAGAWTSQHQMAINGKRKSFERSDLLLLAKQNNIKSASTIISEVADGINQWKKYANEAGILSKRAALIEKSFRTPLAKK